MDRPGPSTPPASASFAGSGSSGFVPVSAPSLLQHPQGVRCHNLGLGGRPRDAVGVLQCAQRARSISSE